MAPYTVVLFYKFRNIADPQGFKEQQRTLAESFRLTGRMLIAKEGINGTFEGVDEDIQDYMKAFTKQEGFEDVVFKQSKGNGKAFTGLYFKVRPEIVTLGAGEFDVEKETAQTVTAQQLHDMYEQNEDFVILDLRNDYEIKAGYFEKTINPKLQNFRDLPGKVSELGDLKNKKVIAVCTGDVRCEKGTCLLKREGFENLYHLKDGIHAYMQEFPGQHFKGSLFVFDNRVLTPVVEGVDREIVGQCAFCAASSEDFYNDDSTRPSRKVICCKNCIPQQTHLRSC